MFGIKKTLCLWDEIPLFEFDDTKVWRLMRAKNNKKKPLFKLFNLIILQNKHFKAYFIKKTLST